jgi:hypothetical protein
VEDYSWFLSGLECCQELSQISMVFLNGFLIISYILGGELCRVLSLFPFKPGKQAALHLFSHPAQRPLQQGTLSRCQWRVDPQPEPARIGRYEGALELPNQIRIANGLVEQLVKLLIAGEACPAGPFKEASDRSLRRFNRPLNPALVFAISCRPLVILRSRVRLTTQVRTRGASAATAGWAAAA